MALHFKPEFPTSEIPKLIAAFREGEFTKTETVDCVLHCAGSINALRGPTPFGASDATTADGVAIAEMADDELADALEGATGEGYGDHEDAEANPLVMLLVSEMIRRVFAWLATRR